MSVCIDPSFFRAITADARLTHLDRSMLIAVAGHAEDTPSRAQWAALAACALSSVPRTMTRLIGFGWLAKQDRATPGGKTIRNAYRLVLGVSETRGIPADTPRPKAGVSLEIRVSDAIPHRVCVPLASDTPRASEGIPTDTPKIPPYDNNSTPLFDNLRSVVGEEGSGEEPACAAPKPKTKSVRGPKLARPATEATMPAAMTPGMRAAADKAGKLNGSGEAEFERWRNHHLAKATAIADHNASFRTWLTNDQRWAAERRGPATTLPDGRVVTYKKHGFVAT